MCSQEFADGLGLIFFFSGRIGINGRVQCSAQYTGVINTQGEDDRNDDTVVGRENR